MDSSYASMKQCPKCEPGHLLPATLEFFYAHKSHKDGLSSRCKQHWGKDRKPRPKVPEGHKWCPGCQASHPATLDYFGACQTRHDKLDVYCKPCAHERRLSNYAHAKERGPKEQPPEKLVCSACGFEKPATLKFFPMNPQSRYGLNTTCRECTNDMQRRNRRKNPERTRQKSRRDYRKRAATYYRPRYQTNRTSILEQQRLFLEENPEVVRGWKRKYARSERGQEVGRVKENRRRARKKVVPGTFTPEQIQEQLKRQHYKCYYAACGFSKFPRVRKDGKWKYLYEIEHTFPLARVVGTDIPANDMSYLVLSCKSCNDSKGTKFPWEWAAGGRLL